mmetsp:Transcript_31079/g.92592  ORF Transcript_31079/g.92592 Transcript_31079/m.92592 type:complete len:228 (-) Transcript_31079:43-726(-)
MTLRKRVQTQPNAKASSSCTALATICSSSRGISRSATASTRSLSKRVLHERRGPATISPRPCLRSAGVQPDEPDGGPGGKEMEGASSLGTASIETTRSPSLMALIWCVTKLRSMCARSRDTRRLAARRLIWRRWRMQSPRLKERQMASAPSTELNVMRRIERVASWLVSSGRSNERPSQVSSYSRSRVRSWSQCTSSCSLSLLMNAIDSRVSARSSGASPILSVTSP